MEIEKDLKVIRRLAKKYSDENWEFRSFLKGLDIEEEELDSIIHQFTREVTEKIDCTECANCCKQFSPVLEEEDITRFALGLKMKAEDFQKQYLKKDKEVPEGLIFKSLPCPFLKDNRCTNFGYRPEACASFPYLHKPEFLSRTWSVMENVEICPIVFNVVEWLKEELWH